MKELNIDQLEELQQWLEKFDLHRSNKKMNRDFSDAVLLAGLLKKLYPKYVEIHNYPPRNSFALKLDNWSTLNRKVLRKIGLQQSTESLENLAKATNGAAEHLLHQIMVKFKRDLEKPKPPCDDEPEEEDGDVLTVNVNRKVGDGIVQVPQKMVLYSLYEKAQETIAEKNQSIALLTQKITHLENFLKLKSQRIDDLCCELAKRPSRHFFHEAESAIKSSPNSSSCLLY